jgi:hypothetical protein
VKTTAVLLKVEEEKGKAWWESLGLPPPWKGGDDTSSAYVVQVKEGKE